MNFYEQTILLIHAAKDQDEVKSRDLWVWDWGAVRFPFVIIEVRLRMQVGHISAELLPLCLTVCSLIVKIISRRLIWEAISLILYFIVLYN